MLIVHPLTLKLHGLLIICKTPDFQLLKSMRVLFFKLKFLSFSIAYILKIYQHNSNFKKSQLQSIAIVHKMIITLPY